MNKKSILYFAPFSKFLKSIHWDSTCAQNCADYKIKKIYTIIK